MKTSMLICKIVKNEGSIKHSEILNYVEELIKMGFLKYDEKTLSVILTDKGESYIKDI